MKLKLMGSRRDIGAGTNAMTAIALGDRADLRRWLEAAIGKVERREPDPGYFDLMTIRGNSIGSPILDEPDFRELRAKLGSL